MISAVMCAYNASPYIGRAVESLLAQTYADFELIVVDDGSTDGTLAILERYAARDLRMRIVAGVHRGISASANLGIAAARRPWIARADADDISMPHRFERQLAAAAAEPGVALWGSWALHVDDRERVLGVSQTGPTTLWQCHEARRTGDNAFVLQPTWLVKRDVLLAAGGYDPAFECAEDLDLLDRIAQLGPTLTIPEPLVMYRIHAASVSMTRFARMRRLTSYVEARRRARRRGVALTLQVFHQQLRRRALAVRALAAVETGSAFAYRRAGLSAAGGRAVAATAWLAGSVALNPSYAVRRIWQQVLSPQARRLRGA